MRLFRRLRTKLTVLYAGMFGLTLLAGSLIVYAAISSNAQRVVRGELQASGAVFDQVWDMRAGELQNGADLLSRDFGFREALATRDEATISSAVANLRGRLGADMAFIVGVDGSVSPVGDARVAAAGADMRRFLESEETPSGVVMIDGTAYEAISAPILSPTLIGWVVFAAKLDDGEMAALEKLSAIPLEAAVLHRASDGSWQGAGDSSVTRFVTKALAGHIVEAKVIGTSRGPSVVLVKPLKSMDPGAPAALLLTYPLALALAPYRPLLEMIVLMAGAGLVMVVAGSWALSRNLTRPISALEEAAHRLQRGEDALVVPETSDEIGRLADSFNAMASEIKERERKIIHQALHDPDTDLPNRVGLEAEIEARIGLRSAGDDRLPVVLALGVDRFAEVRGAIGYGLSSALLAEVGRRLMALHPECRVARLSTDSLGVLFDAVDIDDARRRAEEIQRACEAPLRLQDNTIDVSVTAGLAGFGLHADIPGGLIERANIGLDQARAARQKIMVFDREVYGDPASNLSLMSELRRSITHGELVLHYQPKLNLREGAATGMEALVRWNHPTRGRLAPDFFIGMAEETGHIGALTEWVLAQAIKDQGILQAAGHHLEMSVNISGRLLGDMAFADTALKMAAKAKGRLCFEVTETAVIEHPELALRIIERFASAGVNVSIDDYGAGFSSLTYLKQIPADELKIDKAFVLQMDESLKDRLLVRSTIDLAHSLGMKVTAEGVETETALALLTGMGCDVAQGYCFARPMPLAEVTAFLDAQQPAEGRKQA